MHNKWSAFPRNHLAPLLGVAATLLAVACDDPGRPMHSGVGVPNFSHGEAQPWDTGFGTLGAGSPAPGSDRQEFDFDVAADLTGRLFYRDWAVVRSDGTVGTLTVDPADPETAITAYRDWASACADPTRGAVFEGTGRLDVGDLVGFTVAACDNGAAESGADLFRIDVLPPHEYGHGDFLSSGDVAKSGTATLIFQDGFEIGEGDLSNWQLIPPNNRYSITTNPARVKSGMRSLEALYAPLNTYGTITRWFDGHDEVYVKFHVMFEAGFQIPAMHFFVLVGDSVDGRQSSFGRAGEKPNGMDYFYAGLDPEYDSQNPSILGPFHYYTYYPAMDCPPLYPVEPCYGNRFYQTLPKTELIGGQWQEVVFHIKLNTPLQSNGSQTLWIDGVKKIDVQSMRWRDTTTLRLNRIRFDNWMPDPGPANLQHVWVDDVTVWRP